MIPVYRDEDVWERLSMSAAIAAVREALAARRRGALVAPPRHRVAVGAGSLVFTVGGDEARAGFRVYDTLPDSRQDQITAVWDTRTGALCGVVIGAALGAVRTGAIGGVAVDVLARAEARRCAVLGAGRQARTQLLAACAVRELTSVRVYSRTARSREAFAEEMSARTGVSVEPVGSAAAALDGAHVLLSATTADTPVFDPVDVPAGCHVTVAGPKFVGRNEWDPAVADRASVVVSDALDQLRAYAERFLLEGTPHMERLKDLAELDGGFDRAPDDITLFVSSGLAGTEVFVAQALLRG